MAKSILIFADGTGNEGGLLPDESRTNVYKLYCATRTGPDSIIDPNKQLAFYVPGIGTPTPRHDSWWARTKEYVQQAFGFGITKKVIDCYVAILGSWEPGDRIYLFGFSRGAYTARCVAHVLEVCGVSTQQPDGSALNLDPKSLRAIAKEAASCLYVGGMPRNINSANSHIDEFRSKYAPALGLANGASAYLIGIWDTVAAIGWQRVFPDWTYDRHFCRDIQYARHLQSIDECRKDFKRVAWGGSGTVTWPDRKDEPEQFDQIWFAGNHADIGGSYPENESRLSDITLAWMVKFISEDIREDGRVLVDRSQLNLYPACDGMMHDECMVGIGGTRLHWDKAPRVVPDTATLHQSVYDRLALPRVRNFTSFGPYRPIALQNHKDAKAFFEERVIEKFGELAPSVASPNS
ncbi:phospholipase effector Tle1 domain-containing protein [Nitrobacter sp. TKz-YC02]|uniref:phospholipase effector Tle1 domain-containing protein n=1 Tax=Nitrobacter sp. TKz-YC02 TaxID=3398704 RepID=UPI003CE906E6